ncbi:uncharacterized protein BCR38DRAFT_334482 [Pseudomassariella vexata]|uniref:Mitochondrial distribution and morphology protein 10 n=1 Tax=Pseudomassariella vexata TaxID=1141098 RepID=A0A1Y2EAT6_9PEZI|nr:uncharacterized protein BCR38DRAFT_334482 [Pseudomassariella vexata]ORY68527.1 hypothetical protein BCR38DRAFT_334482 [Pseudomassariella vexata]
MREFMDYIQSAFYAATGWNRDNSYSSLNATADALLSFPTPRGLRITLGSLATPQFATAYQLGTVGVVDGSVSYLYSTVSLRNAVAQSARIPLPDLLKSYKPLVELPRGTIGTGDFLEGWDASEKNTLAYGRLYLPQSMLEALVVKRFSPTLQMQISAVSDQTLRNGGTVLGMVQYDRQRYGIEGLASSDGGLMGVRGLYNFGGDAENLKTPYGSSNDVATGNGIGEREGIYGRFSTGAELYYGTLNKSGGMSMGVRFATLPTYRGTPLTATMTINPLMGNISWSYAVMAGKFCSLATRMDFNVYSYESEWAVGTELWRRRKSSWAVDAGKESPAPEQAPPPKLERSFQAKIEWRLDDPLPAPEPPEMQSAPKELPQAEEDNDKYSGVLKARLDQHLKIGLLWEGRVKSLLFSLGSGIDLRRLDTPFRSLGLEVQFSS